MAKNSSVGAVTDIDGKYSITIEGVGGVLEFSYIGMKKQEIAIIDQKSINVTLQPDTEVLDEVVVVGYGSQKKESVVGAISTLDIKKLKVPGASISNVLAGQLSGVVAMTRSGEPGKNSAADFYIRGVSSFKGTSTPLVLVDGIERDLDLVDTDDIASFSILKDASASAVYGVRGANGVILITTKREKKVSRQSMYAQSLALPVLPNVRRCSTQQDGRNFTMKLLQPSIIRTKSCRNIENIVTPISTRM